MQKYFLLPVTLLLLFTTVNSQPTGPTHAWPVSTAEKEKMIADSLLAFEKDINGGKYGHIDAMFITRNGKLIWQQSWKNDYDKIYGDNAKTPSIMNAHDFGGQYNYYNPWWHPFYRRGELHSLQSVTKTITSIIIGIAVTQKEFPALTTPVLQFFDTTRVKYIDDRKRKMTIQHLLTMTAGLRWNEDQTSYLDPSNDCGIMENGFDWIDYVINKPMSHEPGSSFAYNSGATELLCYIFRKATGKDMEEYAAQHLFAPLGIKDYFWKRTPTGLADTEGGLYLKPADLAKIFYLWLQQGNWNGVQLVSKDWVNASITPFISLGPGVQYGYKWWLHKYGTNHQLAWCGSGFGGQFPVIIPEYNIVAVFNGWNVTDGGPSLGTRTILRRLIGAVVDKK
ncbi:MAG: serine hydrolase [Bacteroidetes bacterium]|nr:serine hydrolase [Bacteroidota bacterium]